MKSGIRFDHMLKMISLRKVPYEYSKEPQQKNIFLPMPELPLPPGVSEEELHHFLRSIEIFDAYAEEIGASFEEIEAISREAKAYGEQHFRRLIYTLDMVRGLKGKCLELGAAPYILTLMMKQFTELDLTLANYYGPFYKKDQGSCQLSYQDLKEEDRNFQLNYHHFNAEVDKFPFRDSQFDVVLFCELIEHLIKDPVAALKEIKRVLKPGGVLIMTTPNVNKLENIAKMIEGSNIYYYFHSNYGTYGRHNREYNTRDLHLLLEYCGFSVDTIFTIDVDKCEDAHQELIKALEPLLEKRRYDLGQCIFIRAVNSHEAGKKRPAFLYINHLENEIDNISIQFPEKCDVVEDPIIALSGCWHGLEIWKGVPTRWMGGDAFIQFYSDKDRIGRLNLNALSYHGDRTLEVFSGDKLERRFSVPTSFVALQTSITMKRGLNFLKFHVPEGCVRVSDVVENSEDQRCLSLAVRKITIWKNIEELSS